MKKQTCFELYPNGAGEDRPRISLSSLGCKGARCCMDPPALLKGHSGSTQASALPVGHGAALDT